MSLLNQLHLFIHQKWSQTRLIKRVRRLREPLLRAKGTTWIVDGNITALIPACIPTLGFDQLGAELEKPLLDGQTDRQRDPLSGNSFIFPAEQPGVTCWTEFHSLRICRMVSSPFPQLLSHGGNKGPGIMGSLQPWV